MLQPFPVIVGPTAGGKSALAVELALALPAAGLAPGEVVTADSMQVYLGMDIGTAKPAADERRGVPHHLIDLVEPREPFSAERWLRLAVPLIDDLRARGRTPIVVGGSHLYVKALLEGLFEGPGADPVLRARLGALPARERRAMLERVDPASASRLHPNDARRTIRALEVHRLTGRAISEHQRQWDRGAARPDALLVGLEWPAGEINRRINARVRDMLARGLVEEARSLWERGALGLQSREALGYKQLIAQFEGAGTPEEAVEQIKVETRRFAKNQRTWLRRLGTTPGALRLAASLNGAGFRPRELVEPILDALRRHGRAPG